MFAFTPRCNVPSYLGSLSLLGGAAQLRVVKIFKIYEVKETEKDERKESIKSGGGDGHFLRPPLSSHTVSI